MTRLSVDQKQVLLQQRNAEADRQRVQSALTSVCEIASSSEHENDDNNTPGPDNVVEQSSEKPAVEPVSSDRQTEAAAVITDDGMFRSLTLYILVFVIFD